MTVLLKNILRPAYHFLINKNYREYCRLLSKYSKDKRYQSKRVQFLDYQIRVVDSVSFIYQFKEIFLDESYKFNFENGNPIIYDCGANIGLSCLYFKRLFPNCTIKAFEADPKIFEILKENIDSNIHTGNIELFNKAIWIDNNGVEFNQEGADGGTVIIDESNSEKRVKVESVRLKDLLDNEKPDFLKMDIEGAEVDVLLDCGSSLSYIQMIFVEYHSSVNGQQKLDQLLQLLTRNGFRYFIESFIEFKSPFDLPWKGLGFDLQLNIYCYKPDKKHPN